MDVSTCHGLRRPNRSTAPPRLGPTSRPGQYAPADADVGQWQGWLGPGGRAPVPLTGMARSPFGARGTRNHFVRCFCFGPRPGPGEDCLAGRRSW
eukprot:14076198-Alexandrium_andersonii.AAC.1